MKEIIISNEIPKELYQKLVDKFNISWDAGVIICYGNVFHCKYHIDAPKYIHELVHSRRQEKIGKDLWWELYINKSEFRLEEEVLAYRAEYKFICENVFDRNTRFEFLYEMARNLSSPQYGSLISGSDAMKLIQK